MLPFGLRQPVEPIKSPAFARGAMAGAGEHIRDLQSRLDGLSPAERKHPAFVMQRGRRSPLAH